MGWEFMKVLRCEELWTKFSRRRHSEHEGKTVAKFFEVFPTRLLTVCSRG